MDEKQLAAYILDAYRKEMGPQMPEECGFALKVEKTNDPKLQFIAHLGYAIEDFDPFWMYSTPGASEWEALRNLARAILLPDPGPSSLRCAA